MFEQNHGNDPLNFVRNLWGQMGFSLPGMVTPTLDTEEIGKQITDLKAVEGWLRMNLSMLQMTIQNLEMQQTTLNAVRSMGEMAQQAVQQPAASPAQEAASPTGPGASINENFAQAAMWPWQMMQEMQAKMQDAANAAAAAKPAAKPTARTKAAAASSAEKKPAARRAPRQPASRAKKP
jgi:hypothetical protein